MIADEAEVFNAESTARSSTGVMKPTPLPEDNNRSKACSVITNIGCNKVPVALSKEVIIPPKSSAVGRTRIRAVKVRAHSWRIVRSHNTPKKVSVDEQFVFEKNSRFAGILLRNKSAKQITIARDSEIATVFWMMRKAHAPSSAVSQDHTCYQKQEGAR